MIISKSIELYLWIICLIARLMPGERAIAIVLTSRSLKLVEFDLKEAIASLKAGQLVILVSLDAIQQPLASGKVSVSIFFLSNG